MISIRSWVLKQANKNALPSRGLRLKTQWFSRESGFEMTSTVDGRSKPCQDVPSDQQRAWDGVQHIGRTQKEDIGQIYRHLTGVVTPVEISHRLSKLLWVNHLFSHTNLNPWFKNGTHCYILFCVSSLLSSGWRNLMNSTEYWAADI